MRSFRRYDGCWNANVAVKYSFALSYVFWCYSLLATLHKIGEVLHFRLVGTKDFHVEGKNERFALSEPKI